MRRLQSLLTVTGPQVDEAQTGEPGWLGGELKGKTGWFPANYAEKIPESEVPLSLRATAAPSGPGPKMSSNRITPTTPTGAQPPLPEMGPVQSAVAPPTAAAASSSSSASSNWADFSTT